MTDIQVGLVTIAVVVLLILVVLLVGYWFFFLRRPAVPPWKKDVAQKLKVVRTKSLDKPLLLIEYDKLLEYALQKRFNRKESLGQMLKNYRSKFTRNELNDIWHAHKLRNKLVHDVEVQLHPNELNHGIIILKQAINNLLD